MAKTVAVVDDLPTMRQVLARPSPRRGSKLSRSNTVGRRQQSHKRSEDGSRRDRSQYARDGRHRAHQRALENVAVHLHPILMLTTESSDEKKENGKAAGWIVKPFNPELTFKVIAKVLPHDGVKRISFKRFRLHVSSFKLLTN